MFGRFGLLLKLSRFHSIGRRYFVVNGFDGSLTMLGILLGFHQVNNTPIPVILTACLGAAIALGISGFSSAYISEAAERKKELKELESAMATTLEESAHAKAALLSPAIIALINGLSPMLLSLFILLPLWFVNDGFSGSGIFEFMTPVELSLSLAMVVIFFLGVFIGKISGQFWLFSGLRTLLIAIFTGAIIYLIAPH
jgi:predicted membrane protein (TIGR00267 family)